MKQYGEEQLAIQIKQGYSKHGLGNKKQRKLR